MYSYAGKVLRVNLSSGEVRAEPLSPEMARTYLGGRGFAARILYDELQPGIDPLSPANKLILATGTLTGTPSPVANRTLAAAKSPLTGLWGDASFGGRFGQELKRAGFDALIIEGAAERPVYLWIHDGQVEIADASDVWGLETGPAQDGILARTDSRAVVAGIGPAGENKVRYGSLLSELRFSASRTGLGAVMGSKRLKAIAVRGAGRVEVAERSALLALTRRVNKAIQENASCGTLTTYGTWNGLTPVQEAGLLPSRNFQTGVIEGGERLRSEAMRQALLTDTETCPLCPIFCRRVVELTQPYPVEGRYGGPQYETVAALGSLVGITDPAAIAKCHELANRYGLDTISAGVCIAFAMECAERGIDLGRSLRWGDTEAVFELLKEIAYQQGLGAMLANGVREAARQIGQGSEAWAVEVKGLELPMHDPRGKKGMGLAYATAPHGAVHMQGGFDPAFEVGNPYPELGSFDPVDRRSLQGKAQQVKAVQDYWGTLGDSLGFCKFPASPWRPLTPTRVAEAVRLATGWDIDLAELLEAGERIFNLCRLFNVREGVRRKDDTVPPRLAEPLPEGRYQGETLNAEDLATMLDEYYALRGWDEDGVPRPETLARLGL